MLQSSRNVCVTAILWALLALAPIVRATEEGYPADGTPCVADGECCGGCVRDDCSEATAPEDCPGLCRMLNANESDTVVDEHYDLDADSVCEEVGGVCSEFEDCCGDMTCSSGSCTVRPCTADRGFCEWHSQCCGGTCRPVGRVGRCTSGARPPSLTRRRKGARYSKCAGKRKGVGGICWTPAGVRRGCKGQLRCTEPLVWRQKRSNKKWVQVGICRKSRRKPTHNCALLGALVWCKPHVSLACKSHWRARKSICASRQECVAAPPLVFVVATTNIYTGWRRKGPHRARIRQPCRWHVFDASAASDSVHTRDCTLT